MERDSSGDERFALGASSVSSPDADEDPEGETFVSTIVSFLVLKVLSNRPEYREDFYFDNGQQ